MITQLPPSLLHRLVATRKLLMTLFTVALVAGGLPAQAAIVLEGNAVARNTAIPTNGSAGALTISRPAAAQPGMALLVSVAARPSQMTWTVPAGWTELSVAAEQLGGGTSTDPGGMTMRTYYKIVGVSEPANYTWTLANTIGAGASGGGSAVAGMLVFSGLDTSTSPLDSAPTSRLMNSSTTTFNTNAVTTTTANAVVVSMISYLSAGSFTYSGTSCGTTEVLDVSTPVAANAVGTTLQMGYFTDPTPGTSCAPQATANGNGDTGVGHLVALKPSSKDLVLNMVRSGPLSPGGTANYSLTINNAGSQSEPGPLTIVNTLPAGLTYSSASGTGWSCSAAGQVVTCQRTGALAAGVSAPALVINVNVSTSAVGVMTNSATASGTGGDGNTVNNTRTDTYVILGTPYAAYGLDEVSWAAGIVDTSGNSRNASVLGSATPNATMPATPGAALPGNPGTCGSGRIPADTSSGINSSIDVNTLGNAGTIAFWYSSSESWQGNHRILFDASADLGNGGADKHFMLVKDNGGVLRFALEDSNDTDSAASSPSYSYPANEWHHIAVSWDLAADRLYVYLDGDTTPVATSTTNVNGTLGDMATLYFGARRSSGIAGAPSYYTANSLNGYIDEIRLYNRVLDPLEIEAISTLRHACTAAVDHYELSIPASASACSPVAISVTACADNTAPCVNRQSSVSTGAATLTTNAGTLDTDGTPMSTSVTFDFVGIATGQLSYPSAATGNTATVTLSNELTSANNARKCCRDGTCATANSCTVTMTACSVPAANFNIIDGYYGDATYNSNTERRIYTKLAGWNETTGAAGNTRFNLDLVALNSAGSTETGFVGSGSSGKDVTLELIDDSAGAACNASAAACAACSKSVVGSATVNFVNADAGYKNNASVSIGNSRAYPRLIARVTDATGSPTVYGCSTDAFAIRPMSFTLAATTSGGTNLTSSASGASGTPTVKAGNDFVMRATASLGYNGTPVINTAGVTDIPLSSKSGLLSGTFSAADSDGISSGSNFRFLEVGYLNLAAGAIYDNTFAQVDASVSDCLSGSSNSKTNGKYGCATGNVAATFGRFIPDHFDTEIQLVSGVPMACPSALTCPTPYNGIVYSGQPFTVRVLAKELGGTTTINYNTVGGYSKSVTLSAWSGPGSLTAPTTAGSLSSSAVPATAFSDSNGYADVALTTGYSFTAPPGAPSHVHIRAIDSEAVSSLRTVAVEGGVKVVTGRMTIGNAFGSEQLPLTLPVVIQYYTGSNWATSLTDSASQFSAAPTITPTTGLTTTATCPTAACNSTTTFTAGLLNLVLSAPTTPGYADVALNIPNWLKFDWDGNGATANTAPVGRGSFGVYNSLGNSQRIIYRREVR